MVDKVREYYQYFYSKIGGKPSYVFRPTEAELAMIGNFVKSVGDSFGESSLFEYFSYQFYYWHDKDTRFGRGSVRLNWVIGSKAYDRWREGKSDWYSYSSHLFSLYGVEKSDLIKEISATGTISVGIPAYEEKDRMYMHNTLSGLMHCSDYTSMYHPNSKACGLCNNVEMCMAIMKSKYSLVYDKRINRAA